MTGLKLPLRVDEQPVQKGVWYYLCEADGTIIGRSLRKEKLQAICEAVNASRDVGRDARRWNFGPTSSLNGVRIYRDGDIFNEVETLFVLPVTPNGKAQDIAKQICDAHNASIAIEKPKT